MGIQQVHGTIFWRCLLIHVFGGPGVHGKNDRLGGFSVDDGSLDGRWHRDFGPLDLCDLNEKHMGRVCLVGG